MTDLELEQISNHVSNIPAVASMYIPALLKAVSELRKERDEALASDAESCAMYRSARDRAEQAEQKLKQTQAEKLESENAALKEALRWYVERDGTFEGGQWESRNAKSLAGKRRAMKLLGMPLVTGDDK